MLPMVHKLPNAKTAHLCSLCVELLRQLLMSNWGPPAFVTKSTALPVRGSGVGVKKISAHKGRVKGTTYDCACIEFQWHLMPI